MAVNEGRAAAITAARRWGWCLVALGLAGLAVVVPISVWTHLGQRADERSRWAVVLPAGMREQLWSWLETVSVGLIALCIAGYVTIALVRRRPEQAVGAVIVVGASNITTQLLKAMLPRPSYGIGTDNTLPSGHMTVVASLLVALVLVLPRVMRGPMVALAGFGGTLAGASIVILRWHRPSDVLAAIGVCAFWYGVALLIAAPWADSRRARLAAQPSPAVRPAGEGSGKRGSGGRHREIDPWDEAERAVEATLPWPDRVSGYFVIAFIAAGFAGGVLILGGLAAHEEASNAIIGGVTLSAAGIAVAALMSLGAAGADGLDAPLMTAPAEDDGEGDEGDYAHPRAGSGGSGRAGADPGGEAPIWSR